jgi:SAM-dependent methyltransferase
MQTVESTRREPIGELARNSNSSDGCPACGARRLESFYQVQDIPAHSCLLMDSRNEALEYPRGQLELVFCRDCGFITNKCYRPALKAYSPRYEETQHFSECFSRFARVLAQRWVDRYDLRGKTILEIGCGKGEFLDLLCTLGKNRGIGIDPGVRPERLGSEANARIRFIRDYYSEKYRDEIGDAVCCRHTLEHIHEPDELLASIRRSIGARDDVILLFELPDTTRVLREVAFWDLYYEHCSYFTAGSLARLFRRNGFTLLELERDYGDQYLLIAARPGDFDGAAPLPLEDDLAATVADVEYFRNIHASVLANWRDRLRNSAAQGQRTVLWGGGSKGVAFLTTLGLQNEIDCVVDINPHKQGKFMPGTGHLVVGPEYLRLHVPDVVVLMNPIYRAEIGETLTSMGLAPQIIAV